MSRAPGTANRGAHRIAEVASGLLYSTLTMKWTGMYLLGYTILVGGVLAALWKIGVLESIGTFWTAIGVVIAIGLGIMIAVANSGTKENIQIDR